MLIESEVYGGAVLPPHPGSWRDGVFRYCTFDNVSLEGLSFDGIMQACTLTGCDFYWGLFNTALLADVRFVDCTFPGTSFRDVQLIGCTFERCRFVIDNMGGDCTIDKCLFADCVFEDCTWEVKPACTRDITSTRWLGCRQSRCRGLEGLF